MVVTTLPQAQDEGQVLDRTEIEFDVGEVRPVNTADDHEIAAAVAIESTEQFADLAPFDPGVRKALDRVTRLAANGDDMERKPARLRRFRHDTGQRTSPGYDPEGTLDRSLWTLSSPVAVICSVLRHCWARRTSGRTGS